MTPGPNCPLVRFPLIDTRDAIELARFLASEYGVEKFGLFDREDEFRVRISGLDLGRIHLAYSTCSVRSEIVFPADDTIRLHFGMGGSGEARLGSIRLRLSEHNAVVTPAYVELHECLEESFERLVVRTSEPVLRRKLEAVLGIEMDAPVRFEIVEDLGHADIGMLREFAIAIARSQTFVAQASPTVRAELGQAWLQALLCGAPHNYSAAMAAEPRAAGPRQLNSAIDYIELNWRGPLLVEDIAAAAGVSARSLFKSFKAAKGVSPMAYVKAIRLEKAHRMLVGAGAPTTVVAVALACGFHNAGHFARDYRKAFGEPPSATLARARTLMRTRSRSGERTGVNWR
jgi:AraC-like DNA-binding protein